MEKVAGMWRVRSYLVSVKKKTTYIDYYLCGCGEKKTAKEAK